MAQEIERKFLVKGDFKAEAFKAIRITQGYLCSVPERTVRVRVKGDKGFITVKGISNASGASRFEWEKEIPVEEVRALLELAEPGVIDKTRYLVKAVDGVHTWKWTNSTATTMDLPWLKWNSPTKTKPSRNPNGSVKKLPATPNTSTRCL